MSALKITILFGSQTGTAEDVAYRVEREAKRHHIQSLTQSLDEYHLEDMVEETLIVFIVSTTGQGDPPDNMKKFWKFILRKNLPADSLEDVSIAVLGLGDSSYLKYNFVAKKLYKRLLQLSAQSFADLACADEQHPMGLDATIDPWLKILWEKVMLVYPLPEGVSIIPKNVLLPPKVKIQVLDLPQNGETLNKEEVSKIVNKTNPSESIMVSNVRKTSIDHFQDVRLITFTLPPENNGYMPGDVLMVQPCNIEEKVKEFFELIPWSPQSYISIDSRCRQFLPQIPHCIKLFELFKYHLSIQCCPKRYFFELLSHFTTSDLEKERLEEFNSAEGQDDLHEYCYKPKRNIIEVLQDFPNACENLNISYLFDLFPIMQPRAFSIASSHKVDPKHVSILMAVVKYKTNMYLPRLGVCSSWLASLNPPGEERIRTWVTKGTITFPKDPMHPVIMVGPGTGVAPFHSFIEERLHMNGKGPTVLFFGCRNSKGDDFFRENWERLTKQHENFKVFTAYSRDQSSKQYVQHKMKEHGELIWLLLQRSAYFYIAGNSKDMPNDVIACLKEIISEHGGVNADAYFKEMETSRRFQCETWS